MVADLFKLVDAIVLPEGVTIKSKGIDGGKYIHAASWELSGPKGSRGIEITSLTDNGPTWTVFVSSFAAMVDKAIAEVQETA